MCHTGLLCVALHLHATATRVCGIIVSYRGWQRQWTRNNLTTRLAGSGTIMLCEGKKDLQRVNLVCGMIGHGATAVHVHVMM